MKISMSENFHQNEQTERKSRIEIVKSFFPHRNEIRPETSTDNVAIANTVSLFIRRADQILPVKVFSSPKSSKSIISSSESSTKSFSAYASAAILRGKISSVDVIDYCRATGKRWWWWIEDRRFWGGGWVGKRWNLGWRDRVMNELSTLTDVWIFRDA